MFEVIHVPTVLIQVHSTCNAGVLRDFKVKTTQQSHPLTDGNKWTDNPFLIEHALRYLVLNLIGG